MSRANDYLLEKLKKNFHPTSNQSPEWKVLLPVIALLQNEGLNEYGPNNPFATSNALERLKKVFLNDNIQQKLLPALKKEQVDRLLRNLTIGGSIVDLPMLYSFCAQKLLEVVYDNGILTAEQLVVEVEKRLGTTEASDNILINALLPRDASDLYSYYLLDARLGVLTHDNAKKIYDESIKYEIKEEILDRLQADLEDFPVDISATDCESLLLRVKDRKNFLQSTQELDRLRRDIKTINSEPELDNMQLALQQALQERKQPNNPYNGLHPQINGDLQAQIRQRQEEMQHNNCLSLDKEMEQELRSLSQMVYPDAWPENQHESAILNQPETLFWPIDLDEVSTEISSLSTKSHSSTTFSGDSTEVENYRASLLDNEQSTISKPEFKIEQNLQYNRHQDSATQTQNVNQTEDFKSHQKNIVQETNVSKPHPDYPSNTKMPKQCKEDKISKGSPTHEIFPKFKADIQKLRSKDSFDKKPPLKPWR